MANLAVVATLVAAGGRIMEGVAENRDAQFEADQLEIKGKEELAAGTLEAEERRREARLLSSRAQAVAAASGAGAGADAPNIVKIMSEIMSRGEYNAATELFGAKSRAQGYRMSAAARRRSGRSSLLGGFASGFATGAGAFS